jgi:hypothetical protein
VNHFVLQSDDEDTIKYFVNISKHDSNMGIVMDESHELEYALMRNRCIMWQA